MHRVDQGIPRTGRVKYRKIEYRKAIAFAFSEAFNQNKSPSTLSGKMRRDNFTEKDLKQIAEVLNFTCEILFTDRETGKII